MTRMRCGVPLSVDADTDCSSLSDFVIYFTLCLKFYRTVGYELFGVCFGYFLAVNCHVNKTQRFNNFSRISTSKTLTYFPAFNGVLGSEKCQTNLLGCEITKDGRNDKCDKCWLSVDTGE